MDEHLIELMGGALNELLGEMSGGKKPKRLTKSGEPYFTKASGFVAKAIMDAQGRGELKNPPRGGMDWVKIEEPSPDVIAQYKRQKVSELKDYLEGMSNLPRSRINKMKKPELIKAIQEAHKTKDTPTRDEPVKKVKVVRKRRVKRKAPAQEPRNEPADDADVEDMVIENMSVLEEDISDSQEGRKTQYNKFKILTDALSKFIKERIAKPTKTLKGKLSSVKRMLTEVPKYLYGSQEMNQLKTRVENLIRKVGSEAQE